MTVTYIVIQRCEKPLCSSLLPRVSDVFSTSQRPQAYRFGRELKIAFSDLAGKRTFIWSQRPSWRINGRWTIGTLPCTPTSTLSTSKTASMVLRKSPEISIYSARPIRWVNRLCTQRLTDILFSKVTSQQLEECFPLVLNGLLTCSGTTFVNIPFSQLIALFVINPKRSSYQLKEHRSKTHLPFHQTGTADWMTLKRRSQDYTLAGPFLFSKYPLRRQPDMCSSLRDRMTSFISPSFVSLY